MFDISTLILSSANSLTWGMRERTLSWMDVYDNDENTKSQIITC